jgi:hypothetical protein
MTCGRVAAVIAGIILLFPGLCFLFFGGLGVANPGGGGVSMGIGFIAIAIAIFWLAWWLFAKVAREPEPWVTRLTEESPKEQEPSSTKEPPKTE